MDNKFQPFPQWVTNRLLLNRMEMNDDLKIAELRSDEIVNRFIDRPKQSGREEAAVFIRKISDGIEQGKWVYWAVRLKDQPDLIGTICLWNFSENGRVAELGYELFPRFHGRGLMDESLKKVMVYAFDVLKLRKLEAYTHKENGASSRLLLNNGFLKDDSQTDPENPLNDIYFLEKTI